MVQRTGLLTIKAENALESSAPGIDDRAITQHNLSLYHNHQSIIRNYACTIYIDIFLKICSKFLLHTIKGEFLFLF